jgi:predicted DNA-binding transcriptional regulator AlpA
MSDRVSDVRNLVGLLTEEDLKDMLSVAVNTLQAWRVQGTGPKFVKLGKSVFYRLSDVTEWIDQNVHSRTSTAQEPVA